MLIHTCTVIIIVLYILLAIMYACRLYGMHLTDLAVVHSIVIQ